jgi:hypothetical protein
MHRKQIAAVLAAVLAVFIGTGPLFAQGAKDWDSESFSGQIEDIQLTEDGQNYEILVAGVNNTVLFRTHDQTTTPIPLADLKRGDHVGIAFNGIMTRSIPPQATADSIQWIIDMNSTSTGRDSSIIEGTSPTLTEKPMPTVAFTTSPENVQVASASATQPTPPMTAGQPIAAATEAPAATTVDKQTPVSSSRPVPLDENTFIYRGIVLEYSELDIKGNMGMLVQEPLPGIGYGQPEIRFIIGPDTTGDFSTVKIGDYVEVTYGPVMALSLPPQTSALNVKILPSPAITTANVIYLGKMFDDKDFKSGSILVRNLANDQEEIYSFDEGTVVNLDILDLPIGNRISLYHRGTMTRSIPAQGFAYCIDQTCGD